MRNGHIWAAGIAVVACAGSLPQSVASGTDSTMESPQAMQEHIVKLEKEVPELKAMVRQLQQASAKSSSNMQSDTVVDDKAQEPQNVVSSEERKTQAEDRKTLDLLRNTTVNLGLDTYYAYNFNHPVGRVNLLRAYDVLSNEFSLNQTSVVLEHAPDLNRGRRWGARLDCNSGRSPIEIFFRRL